MGDNSKVVVVEGPPAIGKSAFARSIAEELEMKYFPMVTDDHIFINHYGFDMREMNKELPPHMHHFDMKSFIKDPKHEKVIVLQYLLWSRRFKQYSDALAHLLNTGQGVVLDRCVYSDPVFNDTFVEVGYIKKHERAALQKMKNKVMENLMKPHLVIYLDAPVSVVEANLKKRGRGEEKVWTREVLEKLENIYTHSYLKTISEHAELLAYDWSTPGDAEVVVEDIERIDFDRFDHQDPKMEDWRIKEDWDWNEKRWDFTTRIQKMQKQILNTPTLDTPQLDIAGEDAEAYERAYEKIPGQKYQTGFNTEFGDKILFKEPMLWVERWPDHDPALKTK